jgi:hypothetical protein
MRRLAIVVVGLSLLVLVFVPSASSAANTYYGTTGAGGGDSLGITFKHGRITSVQLKLHSSSCTNGESLTSEAEVLPNVKLRHGRFSFTKAAHDADQMVTMQGRRTKRGFRGTVSLTVTTSDDTCKTGKRTFTAN